MVTRRCRVCRDCITTRVSAYALEGMCAVAAIRGEAWRAGALTVVPRRSASGPASSTSQAFAVHDAPLAALRESDPEARRRRRAGGRRDEHRRGHRTRAPTDADRRRREQRSLAQRWLSAVVVMTGARVGDPHAGPATAGVREFDAARARRGAARRARRHRAPAPRPGHVRARRAAAPAPRALPRLPRAERRVRRHLRRELRVGRPDEEVSGLEDEYNLAPAAMPKLIYIKKSEHREDRLDELIARIRTDDTAAYLPFEDADELGERVAGDLATLLAERFDETRDAPRSCRARTRAHVAARVPVPYTSTIGREGDLALVRELLARGSDRVVSLSAPAGSARAGSRSRSRSRPRTCFPTARTSCRWRRCWSPECCCRRSRTALGIRDNGEAALEERISRALEGQKVLIVLDNFEQIVEAAPLLVRLYTSRPARSSSSPAAWCCGSAASRSTKWTRCPHPTPSRRPRPSAPRRSSACALFVDRAEAAKPGLRRHRGERRGHRRHLPAAGGPPARDRARGGEGAPPHPAAIAQRLEQQPAPADRRRAGPARAAPDHARDDRLEREPAPRRAARLLDDLGVFATRFTLEAVEAIGAAGRGRAERSKPSPRSSTPRWSSRARSTGGRCSRCSRSCANTRSGG